VTVDTLEARAWQGLTAVATWLGIILILALVAIPTWADLLVPIPGLIIAADTLGPRPLFVRWGVRASRRWYVTLSASVVGIAVAVAALALLSPAPTTDQPETITCAARDLWRGVDPYATYEPQCLADLHATSSHATPLEQGPFRSDTKIPSAAQLREVVVSDQQRDVHAGFPAYGYPPDAALLILPVAFTGWLGISLWVSALTALLLAAIWGRGLPGAAPAFAWQLSGLALLWALFRWNPEDLSYLLLALAFARIDRARLSSIVLAAAICTNPLAWPATPVYLAILARDPQWRARWAWLAGAIAVGTLPWLIWDHHLPQQLWNFATLPEFPIGASLGILARLPSHSHAIFEVGLLAGIGAATFVAWRWPAWRWAMAAVVYGAFLLSWRGPLYYYMPILWLSPAICLGACRLNRSVPGPIADVPGAARHAGATG
jgi:hypothetical protein